MCSYALLMLMCNYSLVPRLYCKGNLLIVVKPGDEASVIIGIDMLWSSLQLLLSLILSSKKPPPPVTGA